MATSDHIAPYTDAALLLPLYSGSYSVTLDNFLLGDKQSRREAYRVRRNAIYHACMHVHTQMTLPHQNSSWK